MAGDDERSKFRSVDVGGYDEVDCGVAPTSGMISPAMAVMRAPRIKVNALEVIDDELAARKRCSSAGVSDLMPLTSAHHTNAHHPASKPRPQPAPMKLYGPKAYKPGLAKSGYIKPPWIREETEQESQEQLQARQVEKLVNQRRQSERITEVFMFCYYI